MQGARASALQEIMIANVFLSSPALGTTKWRGPPLPEWAGIRADSRIIPALSLSGRAQVAIVDAKNGIKEGLQGNWFSCENNSGAQNTGAWVWITRPKSFMKRGAPRALRLKQSGSLPPLFLDNPPPLLPPPSLCPRPLGTVILTQIMTAEGKACSESVEKDKLFTFPQISFSTLVWQRFKSHRQGGGMRNHYAECLSRFWTLCPTLLRAGPKAHLCV